MRYILIATSLLTIWTLTATATDFQSMSKDQIRSEIKARCVHDMDGYGDAITLACMKQDWAAAQQVKQQLSDHPTIAKRCLGQMRDHGYAIVEACIEQDAGAKSQIDDW